MSDSDKEQYVCHNCNAIIVLNVNGRCERCDSDAVISVERLKSLLPLAPSPTPKPESKFGFRVIDSVGYDTVLTYKEVQNAEQALERAALDLSQRWYPTHGDGTPRERLSVKEITRNEYCDWLRRE
jgi:hypothetical protein